MPDISKLKELLERQNALAGEIASQTAEYAGDKLFFELESLKTENEVLRKDYAESERERKALGEENRALKETLKNQLHSERSRFLRDSDARMAAYFGSDTAAGKNALQTIEKNARGRFSELRRALDKESAETRDKFEHRLTELETDFYGELAALRKSYRDLGEDANNEHRKRTSFLGEAEIDGKTADKVIRESDHKVERVIGLGVLGKIGAVIIIIGMIALAQLAYMNFTDGLKCLFMFGVATVILGFALFLNRKKEKRTPFTITILSLGIALEYTALSISYFTLTNVLNVWAALGICIGITIVAYAIAVWLKSEVVTIFAQIGAYLPMFAIYGDIGLIYGAMVYFLILNVLGFLLSVKYKWQILNFVAFGLNIAAVIFVAVSVAVMYNGQPFGLATGLTLGFMFVSFALHTVLPLLTNIRIKTRFTRADLILMGLSTSINLILFYIMFAQYGIRDYSGWLSIFFAAFYFGIYFLARKFFATDTSTRTLFWLTGIVLLGMFVPMHFADITWFTFGWLLEGAVLLIYAILRSKKFTFWTGTAISAAALFSFLFFDIILNANSAGEVNIFIYKYLMLTLASAAVLGAAVYKGMPMLGYRTANGRQMYLEHKTTPAQIFSAAVYLNAAGFMLYAIWKIFNAAAPQFIGVTGNNQYLMFSLMILTLFAFAVFVPKLFQSYLVHRTSLVVSVAAFIFLIVANSMRLPAFGIDGNTCERVAAVFLTALTTLASGYAFYDLFINIAALIDRRNLRAGLLVAFTSYFLFWFTHLFLVQYRLSFTNLTFSIVYIVAAAACLALGLYFRSAMTRRFALVIAGAAIFKLFVIDTFGLELVYRIVCYFVFGAVLIGMSFLYQLFYKKFAKPEIPDNEMP